MMNSKKTPVSILQEYCIRCKEIPKYDLIKEENIGFDRSFTFGIELFNEFATGTGPNKKAAKHETALNLLQLLAGKDAALHQFLKENGLGDDMPIETPYINHTVENYVGKLECLVLFNNLPSPIYNQRYEEGMSHNKTFTCTCDLGNVLSVEASHRTKKQAKHTAAMLMLELLEKKLGNDFVTTIPEDFKVDHREDDFSIERKKVRAHLLGCKILGATCKNFKTKFSPVVVSKLHRVITDPHLEVINTMEKIRGELKMTVAQFNEFLDCEGQSSLGKLCDILEQFSKDTDIEIQFKTLDFSQPIIDETLPGRRPRETSHEQTNHIIHEEETEVPSNSDGHVNGAINPNLDLGTNPNVVDSDLIDSTKSNVPKSPVKTDGPITTDVSIENSTSSESLTNSRRMFESIEDISEDGSDHKGSSTSNFPEDRPASPLVFVMCKVLIVPSLQFMGISPTFEASKRKSAILLLKHLNSLQAKQARKHNFVENFSSGDEAVS